MPASKFPNEANINHKEGFEIEKEFDSKTYPSVVSLEQARYPMHRQEIGQCKQACRCRQTIHLQ